MLRFPIDVLQRASVLSRNVKRLIALSNDVVMAIAASYVAYSLRLGVWAWEPGVTVLSVISLVVFPVVFVPHQLYKTIFRFAGRGMMTAILRGGAVYGVLFSAIVVVANIPGVPRTAGLIQPIIFVSFVLMSRLVIRYLMLDLLGRLDFSGETKTVLVYGAGETGRQTANVLRGEPGYRVMGFIDDDERLNRQSLDGLRVWHSSSLAGLVDKYGVSDVVMAIPRATRKRRSEIVKALEGMKLRVSTLPPMADVMAGRVTINDIREVEIDDLLGRDPVAPNPRLLSRTVLDKTVMITGAGGSIGSELCRQIPSLGVNRIVLYDISEFALYSIEHELRKAAAETEGGPEIVAVLGNVRDKDRLAETIGRYTPDTVFHAAAFKHVPLVEANAVEGLRNNFLGTKFVLDAASSGGVSDFILISTDKAVRPTNIMGATKRLAELAVQAYAAEQPRMRASITRFGNVLGSSGSVVPLFRRQVAQGGPITLTHREVTRFFMTIPEAAQLVIQAAGLAKGGEVFVLDMGEAVRIYDLAAAIVRLSGLTIRDEHKPDGDIEIIDVGLRPGEKLYEELLIGNDPQTTAHPRIMMAHEYSIPDADVRKAMLQAEDVTRPEAVYHLLQSFVPEYTPQLNGMDE